jgi:hypothetical protein
MNLDSNPVPTHLRVPQYFVFSADQQHVGPVTAEHIGRGVVAGKVPPDAFVAPVGAAEWVPLGSVPDINVAVNAARTAVSAPAAPAATQLLPALQADAPAAATAEDPNKGAARPSPLLPLAIFGGFVFVGVVETAITLVAR